MEQSWRWFGQSDPVTLDHIKQAGAQSIVSSLYEQYDGRAWSVADVHRRHRQIQSGGFEWRVCESIPVSTSIKIRDDNFSESVGNWKDNLAALATVGVSTVCLSLIHI